MQRLNHFIHFYDSQVITKIREFTPNLIRQFLLWYQETGYNLEGSHAVFRVLHTFLLWFEDEVESEVWKNPIHKVKAPKLPVKILNPVEVQDVFSMADTYKTKKFIDYRDKAILFSI
jgi:site-specific recombinase XerD